MSGFTGEYLGFTLGNVHSSQLNITRVSSSNRYSENLSPNFTDATAAIPGGDGMYYWYTTHSQMVFTIDFAFDDLREEDLRRLRQVFSFKGVQQLIFDEYPYKKYYVKCSQPPVLKFIPFGELKTAMNYKGEGSVNFVAYYPYAQSVQMDCITTDTSTVINNIGDIEMPIQIYCAADSSGIVNSNTFSLNDDVWLSLDSVSLDSTETHLCIDMRTHLLEGVALDTNDLTNSNNFIKKRHVYNSCISSGDFFNVPTGLNTIEATSSWDRILFNYVYY